MEKNKKGESYAASIIFIVALLIIIGGFLLYVMFKNTNDESLEKSMREPAIDYFDKYGSVSSATTAYKVTLGMLKAANKDGESYNLNALKGCDDKKTYALVHIDYSTGGASDVDVTLKC